MGLRQINLFRKFGKAGVARASILIAIDSVLGLITTLLIYRLFVAMRGVDELGVWVLILSYSGLIGAADISGAGGLARFVSITRVGGMPGKTPADFVDTVTMLVGGLFIVIATIAYLPLKYLIEKASPDTMQEVVGGVLAIALVTAVTTAVAQATASALDGLKRADLRAGLQIASKVVLALSVVLLIPRYGVFGMALGKLVEAVTLLVLARASVFRMIEGVSLLPRHFRKAAFKESISYGGRLQLNRILNVIFMPIVNTLITQNAGLAAVAVFDLANRTVARLRGLARTAAMPMVPVFTEHAHLNPELGVSLLRKATGIILTSAAAVITASVVGAPLLSLAFLNRVDPSFVLFVSILAPAQYVEAVAISTDLYARGLGRLRWNIFAALIMLSTMIVLGFSLRNVAGGAGIVAAAAIAIASGNLASIIGNAWLFRLRLRDVFPARAVIFGVIISALSIVMAIQFG